MAKNTRHAAKNAKTDDHPRPEVIVDLVLSTKVCLVGVSESRDKTGSQCHRSLRQDDSRARWRPHTRLAGPVQQAALLAPQKQIMTLLDSSAALFQTPGTDEHYRAHFLS